MFALMENNLKSFAERQEREFGVSLKNARKSLGWTQEELGQRLTASGFTMHQTTVAKIESGARPTSVAEVAALAATIGVAAGDLLYMRTDDAHLAAARRQFFAAEAKAAHLRKQVSEAQGALAAIERDLAHAELLMREAQARIDKHDG